MMNKKVYKKIVAMKKEMEELTSKEIFWERMDGEPWEMAELVTCIMKQTLKWPHAERTALWAVIQSGTFTPIGYGFYLPTTADAMENYKTIDRRFKKRLPITVKVLYKGADWDTFEINPFTGEWWWVR